MTNDDDLAATLAETAGRLVLELRRACLFAGDALGAAGDRTADAFLCHALDTLRPDDGLLSEERACDGGRLAKRRVWIVDPVDGTREYGEGRDDWAVHVALVVDGRPAAGAVALPALGLVLRADRPVPAPPRHDGPPRMVVSRSRPGPVAAAVAQALGAQLHPLGSAGAKAMAVVRGEAEIYLHTGGQREWDSAAPVAVALANGLHCSRLDGTPLVYNRPDPAVPDLLICRPAFAPRVHATLQALRLI